MLLGADSIVQTPSLRAFETNERRNAKFSETMDPCFVGRNTAVLQYTQFAYADESTRRRMNNAATPKPVRFVEEWTKLDLASRVMRGKADLQKAALIVMGVKPVLAIGGKLLTRTTLAPFGCEEVKLKHGEEEDQSACKLIVPKFPDEMMNEEQGPSGPGRNQKRDDKVGEDHRSEEPMQQDPDQTGNDDDKASTGGVSSLYFSFLDDFEIGIEPLEGTTEPAEAETSTLEPPSAFMKFTQNLPISSSPGKFKTTEMNILLESPRRRRIESTARVPLLGILPEEEWEVYHNDHENRTGCNMDRVAFMEEVCTVMHCYGTQSMLKTGLNRPLMREILDKLDECEGRLSELLIDLATDESEINSRIKTTQQEGSNEFL